MASPSTRTHVIRYEAELNEIVAALPSEEERHIKQLIKRRESLRKDNGVA
jgi:hypothetical protein